MSGWVRQRREDGRPSVSRGQTAGLSPYKQIDRPLSRSMFALSVWWWLGGASPLADPPPRQVLVPDNDEVIGQC